MKLRTYLIKRTVHMIITLLIVLVLLFVLYRMMPGSAAASMMMQPGMTQAQIDQMMVRYGFGRWAEYPGEYVVDNAQPNQIGRYAVTVYAEDENGQQDSFSTIFDVNVPPEIDLSPPVITAFGLEAPPAIGSLAIPFIEVFEESSMREVEVSLIFPNQTFEDNVWFNYQEVFYLLNDPLRSDDLNHTFYFNGTTTQTLGLSEDLTNSSYIMLVEVTDQAKNNATAALVFDAATGTTTSKVWNLSANIAFNNGVFTYLSTGDTASLSSNAFGTSAPAFSIITPSGDDVTYITSAMSGVGDRYTGGYLFPSNGVLTFRIEIDGIAAQTTIPVNSNVATKPALAQDDDSSSPVLSDLTVTFVDKDAIEIPDSDYPFMLTGDLKLKANATALDVDGERVSIVNGTLLRPDGSVQSLTMKHPTLVELRSMGEQFVVYMKTMLVFDFGTSYIYQRPAWDCILERIPSTALLFGSALVLSFAIGIMIGVLVAWKRGTPFELSTIVVVLFFYSMPIFWFALIAQWVFYAQLGWFPLAGNGGMDASGDPLHGLAYLIDVLWHLALPLLTLTILGLAGSILLMRSAMLEVIGEDFITTATAKGLKERTVIYKHAARNAMLPVVTAMAMSIGGIISGGVLTETIFSWYGMGTLLIEATLTHDFPVVQGAFYVLALITILGNMGADILYAWLDPRVQL